MLTQFSNSNDKTSVLGKKSIQISLGIAGLILVSDCGLLLVNRVFHIGTLVPLGIGLIFLGHAVYWERIQLYLASQPSLKKLWQLVWLLFFVWLISFCVFISYLKQHFNTDNHPKAAQAIIVLGGGTKDNKPTDAVKLRLDKASEVIKRFANALVITSGGFDAGKDVSEAKAMADYLHDTYGISLAHIALEEQSTSTELNFIHSKKILAQQGIALNQPIIAVTSDFHTLRASLIGKRQGYTNLQVVGSETPWYIRPNVWFREYFAFISGWLLDEY